MRTAITLPPWNPGHTIAPGPRPGSDDVIRLSRTLGVLGSGADLVCVARLDPEFADEFAAGRISGHRFRQHSSIIEVIAAAGQPRSAPATVVGAREGQWSAC